MSSAGEGAEGPHERWAPRRKTRVLLVAAGGAHLGAASTMPVGPATAGSRRVLGSGSSPQAGAGGGFGV